MHSFWLLGLLGIQTQTGMFGEGEHEHVARAQPLTYGDKYYHGHFRAFRQW